MAYGFNDYLAEKVDERFGHSVDQERRQILEFAKEIALESFKNGKALAAATPKRQNARQTTSALRAGKLKVARA